MNLSIRDAARERPNDLALVTEEGQWTFAALAAAVELRVAELAGPDRAIPLPFVAEATLPALVTLYACLEARQPVALLHPRWPAEIQARRRAQSVAFRPRVDASEESALALLFTSGTTGAAKAVELSRRAFAAAAEAHARSHGWLPHDRWLLALSFAHVGGLSVLTRSLLARKPVVVVATSQFSPAALHRAVTGLHATIVSLVPAQLSRWLDHAESPPPDLRTVLLGGAAADRPLRQRAERQGWPVLPSYGMTETCAQIAVGVPGRALPGVELRTVEGVIEVRSPTLFTAYHGDHSPRTATDAGWFRTGDLGALDGQGCLTVLGRADDVIVTGGEKVNPLAVEAALLTYPGIEGACVVGLPDPTFGQTLAALLVARPAPTVEALRTGLAHLLAPWERPRQVKVVEALPLTDAGKPDRRAAAVLFEP